MATAKRAHHLPARPPRRAAPYHQQALTLIEMMLVLAIIGVVSGISVAIYRNYSDEARIYRGLEEMRSLAFIFDDMVAEGALPDSLADIGADDLIDPWGNPYQYLRIDGGSVHGLGRLRKDRSLVPLNTDYDLYSMGPDGESQPPLTARASHDDLIRANNGGFFGVGEDY